MNETASEGGAASSALDRVQTRPAASTPPARGKAWRWAALVALAAAAAVAAWALWPSETASEDLLARLVATADTARTALNTTDPDEAHDLVLDQLGWSVPPPEFASLALVGATVAEVGRVARGGALSPEPVEVPVFRYEGAGGVRAHVFAYDYILLDQVGGALDLPDATYAVLSEPMPVDSRVVDGRYVVTWRERAMIFSAVTPDEAVAEVVRQSVSG